MSKAKKNLRLTWRFLKGSRLFFFLAVLFTGITALADMVIPQIIKITVDNVIGSQAADFPGWVQNLIGSIGGLSYLRQHLWVLALGVILTALIKIVSQYAFRVFNTRGTETLVKNTRDSLFSHMEALPYSWHRKHHTGDMIQRCTSDIETMKDFVSEELTDLLRIMVLLILSTVFMFRMNVPLTLIAILPLSLIMVNSIVFDRKIEDGFSEFDENEGRLSSIIQENLTGVRVVRAFGRENQERKKFHSQNRCCTKLANQIGKNMSLFWGLSDILTGIQVLLVILFGVIFCIDGAMTAGEFIAFLSYNALLTWPMNDLGEIITELGKTGISIDRIRCIMEAEPEEDAPEALTPGLDGDIVFDHVSFAYENGPEVLHDVSFTMKAGTTLGILGGTGSGKTTLMLLLDKLYPLEKGRIIIGGTDIRRIKTPYLRKNIGMVLQDPELFSGTIGENIGIADETADLQKIRQAAADACLDETVSGFPKGYDTPVGERGVTLSGGQKQRAAIARVLTKKYPILVFDDSTSAVDTETDAKIRASLESRFGSASMLLISHRISTLSRADQIIVLEKGRIAEQGTPEELLKNSGIYRKIYDIQAGSQEAVQ